MVNETAIAIITFLFGAAVGSFLNVVILRSLTADSFARGRSRCPACKTTLGWWELIPIFSFIWLRGRCAHCRAHLTVQYPVIELAAGLAALVFFLPLPATGRGVLLALLGFSIVAVLLALFVIDLRSYVLPDFFLVLLSLLIAVRVWVTGGMLTDRLLSGVIVGSGFLLFLWLFTRGQGIGFGDVKLMLPLGLLHSFPATVALLFIAFICGGFVAGFLLASKRAKLKTAIPFGPFLIGSSLLLLLWPSLPAWLLSLLLW